MKKLKWLVLSLSLLLFLAACGQGEENDNSNLDNDDTDGTEIIDEGDTEGNEDNAENNYENEVEENEETNNDEATEEEGVIEDEVSKLNNVELYFSDNELMDVYRVITDVSVTADEAGALDVYDLWLAGPLDEKLVSLVPEATKVQSVTFEGDTAHVSFSADILDANLGASGESFLVEQIAMLAHQFGFGKTQILVDGDVLENFLGHMDVADPIVAKDPSSYSIVD